MTQRFNDEEVNQIRQTTQEVILGGGTLEDVLQMYPYITKKEIKNLFPKQTFLRKFGVEIETISEFTHVNLAEKLREKGIESDFSRYTSATTEYNHWNIMPDGSITADNKYRNPTELASPVLTGEEGLKKLVNDLGIIKEYVRVNRTCGLHVHFSRSNMSNTQLNNLFLWMALYDPLFFSMLPKSREVSPYCKPIVNKTTKVTKQTRIQFVDKYKSLRQTAKTVEFRLHSATREPYKIENWIRILNSFLNFATHTEFDENHTPCFTNFLHSEKELFLLEYINKRRKKFVGSSTNTPAGPRVVPQEVATAIMEAAQE